MKRHGFDYRAAKRIHEAVRRTERRRDRAQMPQGRKYALPRDGFWAKLTAESGGKYSWRAQQLVNGTWTDLDGSAAYDDTAQYARESWGGTECIIGDVVWLRAAVGENALVFDYASHAGVLVGTTSSSVPGNDGTGTISVDGTNDYVIKNPFAATIPTATKAEACWRKGYWWAISAECDST